MTTSPAGAGSGRLTRFGSGQDGQWIKPDDELQVRTRRHWLVPVRAAVIPALVFAGVLWLQLVTDATGTLHKVLFGVGVAAVLYATWRILSWRHEIVYATDRALVVCSGLIARNAVVVPFDRVVGVDVDRNLLGQLLGYCTLRLETAGQHGGHVVTYLPQRAAPSISDLVS